MASAVVPALVGTVIGGVGSMAMGKVMEPDPPDMPDIPEPETAEDQMREQREAEVKEETRTRHRRRQEVRSALQGQDRMFDILGTAQRRGRQKLGG